MTTDLYLKDLATKLYKFQQKNILCDTVLIAEDNCKVWAHSVILAAVSPYIYTNLLSITGHKAKCRFSMKLSGCSTDCVEAVLRFLYTGSLVLPASFQDADQFSGILLVCERMGIDVEKLNGVAVRFGDVSSLETSSDLMVCEESIHGAAAFNACLDTKDALDSPDESGSTETVEKKSHGNLLTKQESSLLKGSVKLKTEESVEIDSDKPDVTSFEQESNCSDDSPKSESSSAVEQPSFIVIDHSAFQVMMPPTRKSLKSASRKLPQGIPSDWVSVLKGGSKASAVRRSTSIRLAAKVLQKIGMRKNRTVEGSVKSVQESNSQDTAHSDAEQLMHDKDKVTLSTPVRARKKFTSQPRKQLGDRTSDQSRLACKLCNKTFKSAQRLQAHDKMHAGGDRPHVCATCGKTYRFRSSLVQHSNAHNEKRPYLCDICGSGFGLAVNLRRHKMSRHSNIRPFACRECGRGFVREYLLRQHMQKHTGQRGNICPLCGKSFSHRGNLNRHLRNHDGQKQHACIVCGRAFNRKSNMEKHVLCHTRHNSILTHKRNEQQQQHVCSECKKVFRSAKILSRHAALHSSDKSFSCDVCAKQFTTSRYLQQHLVVHREKRFKCKVCAKMFATDSFLSGHMRKFHSDVESLPCE